MAPQPTTIILLLLTVALNAGSQSPELDDGGAEAARWDAVVASEPVPEGKPPADYGANAEGAYLQDTIIEAKEYRLARDAVLTTHTHGVVIIAAESITIDGRIDVHGLGAEPGEPGYASTRAATLALYSGYGEADEVTGEPRLWGAGGDSCRGGGYVILRAPTITINGELDAGSDCGQAGIVILEGTVNVAGTIHASRVVVRGVGA